MSKYNWIAGSVAGGLFAALAVSPAWAVKTDVDGYFYEIPAGADKNMDAVRTLVKASDALGLTRNNGTGTNCLGCTLASHELKGTGTYGGVANVDVVIDFDYRLPAIRADLTNKATKARTITVAAKGLVWDETMPGIFAKAATTPALDRLLPVYLYPSEAIIAAGVAADKVMMSTQGTMKVLTIPIPEYMTTMKATLDAKSFIVATEMTYGGKTYTGDYSAYDTDHMDNHVFLPMRIVQKVDGKVITDLTLEYHWSDPYMLFRTPDELAQK